MYVADTNKPKAKSAVQLYKTTRLLNKYDITAGKFNPN